MGTGAGSAFGWETCGVTSDDTWAGCCSTGASVTIVLASPGGSHKGGKGSVLPDADAPYGRPDEGARGLLVVP